MGVPQLGVPLGASVERTVVKEGLRFARGGCRGVGAWCETEGFCRVGVGVAREVEKHAGEEG